MKICFSFGTNNSGISEMTERLRTVAEVVTAGLTDYSLKGVDIFIGKKMAEEKLAEADRLKAVFAYKTGVDDFPLQAFARRGIALYNSHVNSEYIAEYTLTLCFALTHKLVYYDRNMRRGDWVAGTYWESLPSMKVGLVGYGSIGQAVHRLLIKNDIKTYTIDRGKEYHNITALPSLQALCGECDLIIVSLPKTAETEGMFNEEIFSLLRGKFLVNVGRGNCINEKALYHALKNGVLAGAAIDTWRGKPEGGRVPFYPYEYPFHELDNIIMSSHKAMMVADGMEKYMRDTCEKVLRYVRGQEIDPPVDLTKGY